MSLGCRPFLRSFGSTLPSTLLRHFRELSRPVGRTVLQPDVDKRRKVSTAFCSSSPPSPALPSRATRSVVPGPSSPVPTPPIYVVKGNIVTECHDFHRQIAVGGRSRLSSRTWPATRQHVRLRRLLCVQPQPPYKSHSRSSSCLPSSTWAPPTASPPLARATVDR